MRQQIDLKLHQATTDMGKTCTVYRAMD